jgi:hypothetical protein
MFLLFLVAVVAAIVVLLARKNRSPSSELHFTETQKEGWYVIDAKPAPGLAPVRLATVGLGGVVAIALTLFWVPEKAGDTVSFFVWIALTAAASAVFWPLFRNAHYKKRKIQPGPFQITRGGIVLPNGGALHITGYYAVHRRNTNAEGLMRIAHHVDIDVDGKTYTLAGGMTDAQSMAVFNRVNQQIKGE